MLLITIVIVCLSSKSFKADFPYIYLAMLLFLVKSIELVKAVCINSLSLTPGNITEKFEQ